MTLTNANKEESKNPIEIMDSFLLKEEARKNRIKTNPIPQGKSVTKTAIRIPSESSLTQACVSWFRLQYPHLWRILIHPANEGARGTKLVRTKTGARVISTSGARLKAEGMVAGAADLLLLTPRHGYGCLAIEMKTISKNSKQSENQKLWQQDMKSAGNLYVVCRSFEQFVTIVNWYLK